jgi:hypothetical protein
MAIASGPSASSPTASSPMSSPSPAAVHAPSAPPPLRGGPREPVVHLRPHLLRRRPSVRTTASHLLPPESTAIASLLMSPRSIQRLPSVPHGPGVPHGSSFPVVSPPTGATRWEEGDWGSPASAHVSNGHVGQAVLCRLGHAP